MPISTPLFTHEDDRRVLLEWIKNKDLRSIKVVFMKKDCNIGGHLHRHKDEYFLLLKGRAKTVRIGDEEMRNVEAVQAWEVPRQTYHDFELEKDSVLLGAATKPFDPLDEIQRYNPLKVEVR